MAENNENNKAQFCEKTATTSNETANCQMAASESQASKAPKTGPGCLCTPPGQPSREVLSYGGPVGNQCGPAAVPAPVYNVPKGQVACRHCQPRNKRRCSIQ
ncbi:hypothetical protein ACLKA7_008217 [Drosophila subpalustris]